MDDVVVSESQGVRTLHTGSDLVQGAMRIARPFALELEYTRLLVAPLAERGDERWPRKVLQVGLGAGSIAKYIHRERPKARQVVVEHSPAVIAAARLHFRLPGEDARLRIVEGDGHAFVMKGGGRYDLIVVDAFDGEGQAGAMESLPFYLAARAMLPTGGVLSANLLHHRRDPAAALRRLREAFDGRVTVRQAASGNQVAIAEG